MPTSRDLEGVAKGENKGVVGWLMCNLALYQPNIFAECWADKALAKPTNPAFFGYVVFSGEDNYLMLGSFL